MVRVSPGSPSQWIATRSPRPAATWRSRQLYGDVELAARRTTSRTAGCVQSSTWSRVAVPVQPVGPAAPRTPAGRRPRLVGAAVTLAAAANSAEGGNCRAPLQQGSPALNLAPRASPRHGPALAAVVVRVTVVRILPLMALLERGLQQLVTVGSVTVRGAAHDPLAALLDSPTSHPPSARGPVSRGRRDAPPALRRPGGAVAAEVALRSAVASAALDRQPLRPDGGTRRVGHRPGGPGCAAVRAR